MDHARAIREGVPAGVLVTGVLLGALALCGCGDRPYQDGLDLPEQSPSRFIASGMLTPESAVMVLSQVPPLRYAGGAIEITGGSEIMVVQPQAWRSYTGTALGVEEASRELARSRRLDASLQALGTSADDLLELLHQRLDQPAPAPPGPPAAPAAAPAARRPLVPLSQRAAGRPPAERAGSQDPGALTRPNAARAQQLQDISEAALSRLQQLLEDAARARSQQRQLAEDRDAVAGADALQQQDQVLAAHGLTTQAAASRDQAYQAQLRAAWTRAESQRATSHLSQAEEVQREDREAAQSSEEATPRAIAELHARTARELQQWWDNAAPPEGELTALASMSSGTTPAADAHGGGHAR